MKVQLYHTNIDDISMPCGTDCIDGMYSPHRMFTTNKANPFNNLFGQWIANSYLNILAENSELFFIK